MDDAAMCHKYGLSAEGLEKLYKRLIEAGYLESDAKPTRRRLNLVAILADITAGMSKSQLMKKYQLSEEMLRKVSKKLLDSRGVRSASDGPDTVIEEPAAFLATREFVRHEVDFELPIYEASRPEVHGIVRDISEQGVGVAGIEAGVGDVKTLGVLGDEFGEFLSFEFEGYCRWSVVDQADGTCLTGFAIDKIAKDDLQELRKLVRLIRVGA